MTYLPQGDGLVEASDPYHYLLLFEWFCLHVSQVLLVLDEQFIVETFDGFVKDAYHFRGKVEELVVEFPVKLLDVFSQDSEDAAFINVNLTELSVVNFLRHHASIHLAGDLKVHHK